MTEGEMATVFEGFCFVLFNVKKCWGTLTSSQLQLLVQ